MLVTKLVNEFKSVHKVLFSTQRKGDLQSRSTEANIHRETCSFPSPQNILPVCGERAPLPSGGLHGLLEVWMEGACQRLDAGSPRTTTGPRGGV